ERQQGDARDDVAFVHLLLPVLVEDEVEVAVGVAAAGVVAPASGGRTGVAFSRNRTIENSERLSLPLRQSVPAADGPPPALFDLLSRALFDSDTSVTPRTLPIWPSMCET